MKKRFLSFFLVLSLLVSLLIPAATAAEAAGEESLEITVTVSVQPEEALVFLTDSQANRVFPNEDGTYTLYPVSYTHLSLKKTTVPKVLPRFILLICL